MSPEEQLARLAATLRTEIAPVTAAGYARTQAHMASVVLEKVAREVRLGAAHAAADAADARALAADLAAALGADAPTPVREAIDAVRATPDAASLCRLVEALHGGRSSLDGPAFAAALARVRTALRASIDRRMEVAG